MRFRPLFLWTSVFSFMTLPLSAGAETFVIPFSEIREAIDASGDDPDAAIRAYLAGQIREELDALGFNVDGGLVFADVPVDAYTETIQTDCDFPQPYKVHTDATTATITLDDSSSLTLALDSIRSIDLIADLTGVIDTDARAWVRWGQDVPFVGDCKTINTDHGRVGLSLPLDIDLTLSLSLDPVYDAEQVAIVVDKHALLSGQARFTGGELRHDFGPISLTDAVLDAFEDELLEQLGTKGSQVAADAITALNHQFDGLDEDGLPDPAIEPFNAPSTFVLSTDEEDQAFIRELLEELGIPEIALAMAEDRGVEILLQLVVLEGDERDAFLAALGAEVGCEALLGAYQVSLDKVPIYALGGQGCAVADVSGEGAGGYFSDASCTNEIAYEPTDEFGFCVAQFGDQAGTMLGNAASWIPDNNQPGDVLPSVPSRPWTTVPTTELDMGVVSLQGNYQPYMKQLNYKTIAGVPRGTGTCELEMRVYKRDVSASDLRPMLALHGGTWQNRGFSFSGLEAGVSQFTERGFIVFAPFYRLVGDKDGNIECNGASWREVTQDVESALDWVVQNGAALGAEQEPVTVFGQSAGAHLATWLAANRPADVRKALLYYGPTDALEFLSGAVPLGGPYESYRSFGLKSLERFFGARQSANDLQLEQINFAGMTPALLSTDWQTLIPDTVFDLSRIDPLAPPVYVARCAAALSLDLATINLSMPPPELVECMKQDLGEFLVENSFNHQLGTSTTPMFIVHGSGDTVVPHAQAVNLCGAIGNSTPAVDVVDPLTVYSCAAQSRAYIAKDADHALDLGVCIGPLCPAGAVGSEIRDAVATAINASYAWLPQDDADGDGVPDDEDAFPNDPDESVDSDGDGIGNNADTDDDNDGVLDVDEIVAGTDPTNADTDGDVVADGADNCPIVANPDQHDADHDGFGNACDMSNDLAPFDYDGDGRSDILWYDTASGETSYWQMDGATTTLEASVAVVGNLDWQIVGTGDYNGDGNADILWRNRVTGQNWMYLMNGMSIASSTSINTVSPAWRVVGNGDYDGDGKSDILLRHGSSGQNWMYLMDGASIASSRSVNTVPTVWQVAGSGDYNGDGKSDILLRHDSSGQNWMYLMDGATIAGSRSVNTVPTVWQVTGSGDYNGDGKSDILLRHGSSGQNWMYLMDGASIASSRSVNTVPTVWQVAGSGDYNGDGKSDILLRHGSSGQNWMYLMDGNNISSSLGVNPEHDVDREVVRTD